MIPGYRASTLSLEGASPKIKGFLDACKTYEEVATRQAQGGSPQPQSGQGQDQSAEKEAFDFAKELGVVSRSWWKFEGGVISG
jgi:hypothetical protein